MRIIFRIYHAGRSVQPINQMTGPIEKMSLYENPLSRQRYLRRHSSGKRIP